MNLSEHFTKEELCYSDTAKKYKKSNDPTPIHLKTLIHTCQYFLEPLRKLLNEHLKTYKNKPVKSVGIKITSGYRSNTVNELLRKEGYKPSTTSQHCTGEAVDFEVCVSFTDGTSTKLPYTETYSLIKTWVKGGKLSVDQLICEKSGNMVWVHASYKAGGSTVNRNQFMLYQNGKYITDK
jgi:hypothetical protein